MYHRAKAGLSIRDIQQILLEDQSLFDKTIAELKQRNPLVRLNASQSQHHVDKASDGQELPMTS